jgi:gamma-tubulin complex component 3
MAASSAHDECVRRGCQRYARCQSHPINIHSHSSDTRGGALVNLIHGYTATGDPFVRGFTDRLLEDVSAPFFVVLARWLFAGELVDPFVEFFVAVDPELERVQYAVPAAMGNTSADIGFGFGSAEPGDGPGEGEGAFRLWENKYQFVKQMLPAFVSEPLGRKV